jgi:hypothetical protein
MSASKDVVGFELGVPGVGLVISVEQTKEKVGKALNVGLRETLKAEREVAMANGDGIGVAVEGTTGLNAH